MGESYQGRQHSVAVASSQETPVADTPTFGRYAEIPYDKMTPEQLAFYDVPAGATGMERA